MPKQRKSKNQLEKEREQSRHRNEKFLIKKDMERESKDSIARQVALDKLGIAQEFSFEDHDAIYSYADYSAPIKTIDASIAPPAVTEYPEYPLSEFSTPPAFNVAVAKDRFRPKQKVSPRHGPLRYCLSRCLAFSPCPENFGCKQYCCFGAVALVRLQNERSFSSSFRARVAMCIYGTTAPFAFSILGPRIRAAVLVRRDGRAAGAAILQ